MVGRIAAGGFVALGKCHLVQQLPLGSGVGDTESLALGVALGFAAGKGTHHGEIALVVECVAHPFLKKCGLEPTASKFGDG